MLSVLGSPGNSLTKEWSQFRSSRFNPSLFLSFPSSLLRFWFFKSFATESTDRARSGEVESMETTTLTPVLELTRHARDAGDSEELRRRRAEREKEEGKRKSVEREEEGLGYKWKSSGGIFNVLRIALFFSRP